ncbi:MAG: xanthine dehydrogenase family protein subunit M [Caldilineaceae bacterium]|nr:xanthine dehydrogenase family protein subunit M [Caldilineaceae bacterium]MCB0079853.1 xanthine dehydrogenase family protein subunit M [Caldilineaceae bacterium]
MQAFDFVAAQSVDEVIGLLAEKGDMARVLSGGTDLLVALREGRRKAELVIDVKGLPETTELSFDAEKGLTLGAAVPCHRMYNDGKIAAAYNGLMDSAHLIGGTQIQGRASMGGNLCNASPAADSIPNLIAYGAVCNIAGPNGRRQLPVEEFCTGPGRTALGNGEFLVSLELPAPKAGFGAAYLRFIPRNEMDIAVVGVGAAVQLDESRSKFVSARIALGAVAPTPLYVEEAGASLVGKSVNEDAVAEAAKIAQAAAKPISDMRGTAEYRKHLVGVLTRRTLQKAIERAKAN